MKTSSWYLSVLLCGLVVVGCSDGAASPETDVAADTDATSEGDPAPQDASEAQADEGTEETRGDPDVTDEGDEAADTAELTPEPPYEDFRACPLSDRVGQFQLELAELYTGVVGLVYDGVIPSSIPTEVVGEGDCVLYQPNVLFCDPPCEPGETCDSSGECIPFPLTQNVGTVTITGMAEPVTMNPLEPGNFYTNSGSLPHPAFEHGDDLTLAATGGAYQAFTLRGRGIAALTSTAESALIQTDTPLTLTWDRAPTEGPAQIHLELNIALHGGTPSWLQCDVPDTGAYTIPATLISELMAMGYSGFPQVALTRRTADATEIELGCIQFEVLSTRVIPVDIPGLISCTSDEDCPEGQTCQGDLTCG